MEQDQDTNISTSVATVTEPDTTTKEPVVGGDKRDDGKKNKENGWRITAIVAIVLAVCGIGFGVYELIQGSKRESRISDLEALVSGQIINNDKTNNDNKTKSGTEDGTKTETEGETGTGTKDETRTEEGTETKTEAGTGTTPADQKEQGYFYLDEFGIKIKLSDNAWVASHAYSSGYYGLAYTDIKDLGTYAIWVIPSDRHGVINYSSNTTPDYAIRISRYSKNGYACHASCGVEVFDDGEYVYMIYPRNSTITNYDGTVDEAVNNSVGGFVSGQYSNETGFFNRENYSKI